MITRVTKFTMKKLFLTGYEKSTPEDFVPRLLAENITSVIDVRETPLSRKNGFSKVVLKSLLEKRGIKYFHIPALGSPKTMREKLKNTNDYLSFFNNYRKYVKTKTSSVKKVIELVKTNGDSSALLCFEKNSDLCHRSIIASEILKKSNQIKINSL